ncbi:MAG: HAMP domain-containing histidine kinase [Rhodocyclales bacterium]|nr:HAMP domain-containing histidine kinase [Rhodocyclales bacterium]
MLRRHSLRFRVAAYFALLGALLSLLFAVGIWFAAHDVSQRLMDQTLNAELDDYMARRARNPHSLPPDSASLRGYVTAAGSAAADMPPAIAALPPGRHEIVLDAVPYRVAVAERNDERYVILFSEARQRLREQRFLIYLGAGALLMTLLAAAGGHWLAGRVIAPVTDLAREVAHAPPDDPPRLAADGLPDDEIAELRRSFDRYFARLAAFVERERIFAADASHELRTPLAIIRGAAEVLAEDAALTPGQAERVARIARAAAGMTDLTAALLLLAREETAPVDSPCDCAQILRDCVERQRSLALRKHVDLELAVAAQPTLRVAPALFAIVADNLLRNALAHTESGLVALHLDAERLTIADSGRGIDAAEMSRVFERYFRGETSDGSGIGLSLVKRICDRQGWLVLLAPRAGGGTEATLRFAP